jgi:DNA relaxase NicK
MGTYWNADVVSHYTSVDYIRMTLQRSDVTEGSKLAYHHAMTAVAPAQLDIGEGLTRFRWQGYDGWRLGQVFWGERLDGIILQASGTSAHEVAQMRLDCTNVPRIDIQITFTLDKDCEYVAKLMSEDIIRKWSAGTIQRGIMRLIDGFGKGDTLYVGKRGKNSRMLRIYDKWREQGLGDAYRNMWRIEVELGDNHARAAYEWLSYNNFTEQEMNNVIGSEMQLKGLIFDKQHAAYRMPHHKRPKDRSVIDRRREWLHNQVRPSIEKMVSLGVEPSEIIEILGLTEE